jgi:hypothetical protein
VKEYSAYDFLSFVLPGGLLLFIYLAATGGLPTSEPGAGTLAVYAGAAFLIGQLNGVASSYVQPVFWGHGPWTVPDSSWGVFGRFARYKEADRERVTKQLRNRFPGNESEEFQEVFNLGYTLLQVAGKDDHLKMLNAQIGFFRNTSVASGLCVVFLIALDQLGQNRPFQPVVTWFLAACAVTFYFRYRYAWSAFGNAVCRGVIALPETPPASSPKAQTTGNSE